MALKEALSLFISIISPVTITILSNLNPQIRGRRSKHSSGFKRAARAFLCRLDNINIIERLVKTIRPGWFL